MKENVNTQYLESKKTYISFIIPVYNTNNTMLSCCIQSVLNLKNDCVEIIIINDGSTKDETISFLKKCSENSKIIIVNKENGGPALARSVGIDYSRGEYLVFLDSDDMIETDKFNKIIAILNRNKDVDILYHTFDVVDNNGRIIKKGNNTEDIIRFECFNANRDMKDKLVKSLSFDNGTVWAKIYKRSLISDLRFNSKLKYCEDNLFNSLLNRVASKFIGVDISAYIHSENPDSLCHKYNPNAANDFSVAIQELEKQYIHSNNLNGFYRTAIFFFYINHVLVLEVFNSKNSKGFIRKCRQAKNILSNEPYKHILDNIQVESLTMRQKIVYKFLKKRLVWIAYKLYFFGRKKYNL